MQKVGVVDHTFDSSNRRQRKVDLLSVRLVKSAVSSRPARATQKDLISKVKRYHSFHADRDLFIKYFKILLFSSSNSLMF